MNDDLHSFGQPTDDNPRADCLECPGEHGGPGPCDHRKWSNLVRRFVARHIEEFTAAYENPDPAYSSHLLQLLGEELGNLSRGHICNEPGGCPVENKNRGIPPCPTCRARWEALASQVCLTCTNLPRQFRPRDCRDCAALSSPEFGVEIGRTAPVTAPAPLTIMLDYCSEYMSA